MGQTDSFKPLITCRQALTEFSQHILVQASYIYFNLSLQSQYQSTSGKVRSRHTSPHAH